MKRKATQRASDGPAGPARHGRKPIDEAHVSSDERTGWRVDDTDADAPICEHRDIAEAELSERALGARR